MEKSFKHKVVSSIKIPSFFLLILWTIQTVQAVTGFSFARWGIYPLHEEGLIGVISSPMIHGSWMHLINNSFPFFVGFSLMLFFYRRVALKSFVLIYLLTGSLVWLFGKPAFHIGLSGVDYGIISFLFWGGVFRRNIQSIAVALTVVFLYSGMLYGVLPNQPGISWESHLFGAIVGGVIAYLFRNQLEPNQMPTPELAEPYEETYFFEKDLFEKEKIYRDRY